MTGSCPRTSCKSVMSVAAVSGDIGVLACDAIGATPCRWLTRSARLLTGTMSTPGISAASAASSAGTNSRANSLPRQRSDRDHAANVLHAAIQPQLTIKSIMVGM
jgi:hypothetical protein